MQCNIMNYLSNFISKTITVLALLAVFTQTSLQPLQAQEEDSTCEVNIISKWPSTRAYPGQEAEFEANVTATRNGVTNYTWTVDGPIIKDYDDSVQQSDYLKDKSNVGNYTVMSPSDFQNREIKFYWQPNTTNTNRTISVVAQTSDGATCEDSQDYDVRRSTNIKFQPEDFYVDYNHREPFAPFNNKVLREHQNWHTNVSICCEETYDGTLFLDFHHLFLRHFDAYRNLFGYDNITQWNPNEDIPRSFDTHHANREIAGDLYYPYLSQSLPEWFKIHPGNNGTVDRIPSNRGCENASAPQYPSGDMEDSLGDFPADRKLLGCVITSPFHNTVHRNIGQYIDSDGDGVIDTAGDMGDTATAPKDPIFWRFHKFVDEVSQNRTKMMQPTGNATAALSVTEDISSPQVISQNPFRLNPFITELPRISEQEKDLFGVTDVEAIGVEFSEPVIDVNASDLSVNESSAGQVNGTGSGPYVFIGFKSPGNGPVNVTMSSGNITDISGNKFVGESWNYTIVDENQDLDADGAKDDIEVNILLTNPTVNDTDGDTMPDGFEATTPCLDALRNDTHFMDITNTIVSDKPLDADDDGFSNIQEFQQGTDPCSPTQIGMQPPSNQQDFLSENQGILPLLPQSERIVDQSFGPFLLEIEKRGGISGNNIKLLYNSLTKELLSIVNNNETRKQINNSDEATASRILNGSGFFEAEASYPPAPNSTDYEEFTISATLDGKLNSVYWTTTSEGVPEPVANLPFILAAQFGTGMLF